MAPRVNKLVESSSQPIFGAETEELQALRDLAKVVDGYLYDAGISGDDLIEAFKKVKAVQKKKRKN